MTVLTTPRLRLEPFTDAHFEGLQALNSLPEVMRYISGRPETPEETLAMIERVKARWDRWGFSWWSIFERETDELIGACGVQHLGHDPDNPLELGWRLHPGKWGKGFASEAAGCAAQWAFDELNAGLLCAVCDPGNRASSRVMERLGMRFRGEEMWNERNVAVYEIGRDEWLRLRREAP